ncbi:hypothetical protein QQ054_15020 [Oscillatoria amoena NRMC-F 0135]|nr:hypothetical protein [Oscillatoria amoena NRMC-F 0135]
MNQDFIDKCFEPWFLGDDDRWQIDDPADLDGRASACAESIFWYQLDDQEIERDLTTLLSQWPVEQNPLETVATVVWADYEKEFPYVLTRIIYHIQAFRRLHKKESD